MKTHTYSVAAPDGSLHTRTTARTYTHVVFGKSSFDRAMRLADSVWANDAHNHRYYCAIAGGYMEDSQRGKYETEARFEERLSTAKAAAALSLSEYLASQRLGRIARVNEAKARGYYDKWLALAWCGRRDLADKQVGSLSGCHDNLTIVEVPAC